MNKWHGIGRLTKDPEARETVTRYTLAVDRYKEGADFINCVTFGTQAEFAEKYLHKGIKVAIDGKLRWSQWEREGQKRSKVEVTVDDIEILTPKGEQPNSPQTQEPIEVSAEVYDDDITF